MARFAATRDQHCRMRDLVAHAIEFYGLEDTYGTSEGREAIVKSIRRAIADENQRSEADGRGTRFAKDSRGYLFTADDMRYLIETKLYTYFLARAPKPYARSIELVRQVRESIAFETENHNELLHSINEELAEKEACGLVPDMPHEAMDLALITAMLTLLIDKLYKPQTFDRDSFERDFREKWELDSIVDFSDRDGRVRIEQLNRKLTTPREYLVSTHSADE